MWITIQEENKRKKLKKIEKNRFQEKSEDFEYVDN